MIIDLSRYLEIRLTSVDQFAVNVGFVRQIDVASWIRKLSLARKKETVMVPRLEIKLFKIDVDFIIYPWMILFQMYSWTIYTIVKNYKKNVNLVSRVSR